MIDGDGLRRRVRGMAHSLRHGDATRPPGGVRGWLNERGLLIVEPPASGPYDQGELARDKTDDRATFADILLDTTMPEQLEWLADHVTQSIPYFYIEELVHTWASIHFGRILYGLVPPAAHHNNKIDSARLPEDGPGDSGAASPPAGATLVPIADGAPQALGTLGDALMGVSEAAAESFKQFAGAYREVQDSIDTMAKRAAAPAPTPDGADELVRGLWHLLAVGILPPEAGWSALAALIAASDRNAVALAKHVAVDTGVIDPPYKPVRHVPLPRAAHSEEGSEGDSAIMTVPVYERKHATIRDEAEALACFAAFVDAARRVTDRANRKHSSTEDGEAKGSSAETMRVVPCGPPLDLLDRTAEGFGHRRLQPPLRAYSEWIDSLAKPSRAGNKRRAPSPAQLSRTSLETGSLAAAMDPLVFVLASVDAALLKEAAKHQRNRYDFAWTHPTNWFYPLLKSTGMKTAPPAFAEANAALGRGGTDADRVRVSLRAIGSGSGGAAQVDKKSSATAGTPLGIRRCPSLPFRVDPNASLASALRFIAVPGAGSGQNSNHGGNREGPSMGGDPERLAEWLRQYSGAAARNIAALSRVATEEGTPRADGSPSAAAVDSRRAVATKAIAGVRLALAAWQVDCWATA